MQGDDEEFGGIEGNQLMNNYFNNDLASEVDSDDDDAWEAVCRNACWKYNLSMNKFTCIVVKDNYVP